MKYQIVKIIEGDNQGLYLLQKKNRKGEWVTASMAKSEEDIRKIYAAAICPIIGIRIVNDITFALRFKHFLEGIQVCDACSDEELEYLKSVADQLLEYQRVTVEPNSDEERYLKNNGVL